MRKHFFSNFEKKGVFKSPSYRVSKTTVFPAQSLRSHSRDGKAPGSSLLSLPFEAILYIDR